MADPRDFLLEEIKHLLKDIDYFLNATLKKEKLKKEVGAKREELSRDINSVITRVDSILPQDCQEEYADLEPEESGEAPPIEEDGELYEDTAIPDSPNKNVMSQGSAKANAAVEDAEPPEMAGDEALEPYGDMKIGPIAATDLQKTTMEGFLEKRRKEGQIGLQQWQRRFCVIKENIFYYFKNRNDKQQKNVIILNGYEARPNPDFDKKHKRKDYLFELVCPAKRSFQFIASSNEEMSAWISAVAVASNFIPPPEPAATVPPLRDIPEDIPGFDETYDDVDTYQKSSVPPPGPESAPDDSGDIYDDTAVEDIDAGEVYEDVASQPPEPAQRLPPPHHHGPLPDKPPASPTLHKPSMRLPDIPAMLDRPKPEPASHRQSEEKPPTPRRGSVDSGKSTSSSAQVVINSAPPEESIVKLEPWEEDYPNIYVGMWDCNADDENELDFKRGDLVHIISKEYESFNWWVGERNRKVGLVPKEYLMLAYAI